MNPTCPDHDRQRMRVEDTDTSYGQTIWTCPIRDCNRSTMTGPSDQDIYRREHTRTTTARPTPMVDVLTAGHPF